MVSYNQNGIQDVEQVEVLKCKLSNLEQEYEDFIITHNY